MKILYLHQYFRMDIKSTRSFEISKHLIQHGHEVTVVTGFQQQPNEFGIKVLCTNTNYRQSMNKVRRILSFFHYLLFSFIYSMKEKDVDVVYASSTPLTIGITPLLLKLVKKKKYIFEVRDLWPDVPIKLGYINNKILIKLLLKFEMKIYNEAEAIVVLSTGMKKRLIEKGVHEDKITVVENMALRNNLNKVQPYDLNKLIQGNVEDKLICIHHGTMGYVNGLDYVLDLAEFYPHEQITYLLIGDGQQKEQLKKRIEDRKITNVYMADLMNKEDVFSVLKSCDVGLMIVRNNPVLEDNSANKFYDFLAAGLPVLVNYGGWQKEVLESNGAGAGIPYDNKKGAYEFLERLAVDKFKRHEMGKSSEELSMKYDVKVLCDKILKLVQSIK